MNNCHYLLRDSNEIFGIYMSLEIAYNHLLQFIYNLQRYYKIISGTECSIKPILNNFQIIQYNDNLVVNLYSINSNFCLVDSKLVNYTFNTLSITDFVSKLEKLSNNYKLDQDDLNLFIPINFTDTEIKNIIQPSEQQNKDINKELQDLQHKMSLLTEIKNVEQNTLNKIKQNIKSKEEQTFLDKVKSESIKQKIEQKKEYYEKTKNKYKIDKNIYFKIKQEIEEGKRSKDKLPELFIDDYKIFTKMEENKLLSMELSDDEFQEYLKYKPEKKQTFVTMFDDINDKWIQHSNDTDSSDYYE